MINIKSKARTRNDFDVDFDIMKSAALVLRALNHKVRQQILMLIHKNENMSVSEIYRKLKLEQSITSSHLALLRKAGVVITKRDGQVIYYRINYPRIAQIEKSARGMFG